MSSSDNRPLSGRGRGNAPSGPSRRCRAPSRQSRGRGGRATSAPSRGGRSPLGPSQGRGALESTNSNQLYCKNTSCGNVLRMDTVFCRICSCHLCGEYDEPRDNSLWITCQPDNPQDDSCEFSCHIKCAIKAGHLGASSPPFPHFDASYWCTLCGKVSDIFGCWKKLVYGAKDAENLGDLCDRLSLSCKLLENASRNRPLNLRVEGALTQLEWDVGPLGQLSDRMKKSSIIQRPAACNAQKICKAAVESAIWIPDPRGQDDACRILVTDVYASSIVMRLNDCKASLMDGVIRFDIWCWRHRWDTIPEAPTLSIGSHKTEVKISGLQPDTEYVIKIESIKTAGSLGVTMGKCTTKNASIIHRSPPGSVNESLLPQRTSRSTRLRSAGTSQVPIISVQPNPTGLPEGLPVIAEQASGLSERAAEIQPLSRSCGMRLRSAGTSQVPIISIQPNPTGMREGLPGIAEQVSGQSEPAAEIQSQEYPPPNPITCLMDLNADPFPDLNDDVAPPTSPGVQQEGEDASRVVQENTTRACPPATEGHVARAGSSTGPKENTLGGCIRTIVRLEREGHITEEFRKKFLTWFSLEAKEDMKEVVYLYLDNLSDDLKGLADQLLDTFSHIVIK